jgi:DNA modification methylase
MTPSSPIPHHNETQPGIWPADRVVRLKVESLVAYAHNARTHTPEQIRQIADSIKRFGFTTPVIVDERGVLIAGHARVMASRLLGLDEIPGIVIKDGEWSEEEKRAYRIWDNQSALLSSWDREALRLELGELRDGGFDLAPLGFDVAGLAAILDVRPVGATDPDEAPEPPVHPVAAGGDLWALGRHRLLVGDCTEPQDVNRLMDGAKAVLMATDPPFGVNYGDIANSRSRAASVRKGGDGKNYATHAGKRMQNDDLDGGALQDFLERTIRAALPHLIENPAFYLWHPMLTQGAFFAAAATAADILIHRQIIWVKPSLIMGRGDYHWRHELCFYGWIRGKRCAWLAGRDQDTIWEVGRENDGIHPTQKPVELFARPIRNHVQPGGLVFEPFSGSGSQIIAAEMTGRRCYAIEIDPRYADCAILRWQNFAGEKATLDGRTFAEVKDARHDPSRDVAEGMEIAYEARDRKAIDWDWAATAGE